MTRFSKAIIALGIVALLAVGVGGYVIWSGEQGAALLSWGGFVRQPVENRVIRPANSQHEEAESAVEDAGEQEPAEVGEVERPAPAGQDAVVRTGFVNAAAEAVVAAFVPAFTGSQPSDRHRSFLSFQRLNVALGVDLPGIVRQGEDIRQDRAVLFAYLAQAGVLESLFELYADRFVQTVDAWAARVPRVYITPEGERERVLDAAEREALFRTTAPRLVAMGQALRALAVFDRIESLVRDWERAVEQADVANARFQVALTDESLAGQVSQEGDRLKAAIAERERLRQALLKALREQCAGPCGSDEDLLYMAQWVKRRHESDQEFAPALLQTAGFLDSMAQRFQDHIEPVEDE